MGLNSVIQEEIDKYAGPVLIYDTASIRANMVELIEAFGHESGRVLFPVKSFPALPM